MTCELCGGASDDPDYERRFVETPEEPVIIHFDVESCADCRDSAMHALEQRGRQQQSLCSF